jgi:hypothetical protein
MEVAIAEFGAILRTSLELSERSYGNPRKILYLYWPRIKTRENSEHEDEMPTNVTLRQIPTSRT